MLHQQSSKFIRFEFDFLSQNIVISRDTSLAPCIQLRFHDFTFWRLCSAIRLVCFFLCDSNVPSKFHFWPRGIYAQIIIWIGRLLPY